MSDDVRTRDQVVDGVESVVDGGGGGERSTQPLLEEPLTLVGWVCRSL